MFDDFNLIFSDSDYLVLVHWFILTEVKVKINKKEEIAEGTLQVELGLAEGTVDFKAGQFFSLKFPQLVTGDGRSNVRLFGLVNSPAVNTKIITITREGVSDFKKYLQTAEEGIEGEVREIKGDMTLPENNLKPLVIITGGIGIVPYLSMVCEMFEKKLDYSVTLIYSNTNKARTIYLDKLQEWAKMLTGFKLVLTMTQDSSWPGQKGRIDEQMIRESVKNIDEATFMISGTPRFVPSMVKLLNGLGVKPENRKFEIFTGY
jgi:glycine betaine catabolism B